MERRKILLGSGAALATVLAGCSSDETGDDSESNDNDDESLDGNGTGNGDGNETEPEVPGLDRDKLKVDSSEISIEDVNKDGDEVDVVATTTTTDPERLREELQSLGETLAAAITDREKFKAEIKSVTWVLEKDGAKVMSFYVDVEWAIAFINDEMSEEEFVETVFDTTDET